MHVKNENYWISGQPYFDQVRIINFPSDAAKVNALLAGQIEAMADVPFAQVPIVRRRNTLRIYTAQTGAWTPLCMNLDDGPVQRRARAAGVPPAHQPTRRSCSRASRASGASRNDVYSPFDPAYAGDEFPQRRYDPEQAKVAAAARPARRT